MSVWTSREECLFTRAQSFLFLISSTKFRYSYVKPSATNTLTSFSRDFTRPLFLQFLQINGGSVAIIFRKVIVAELIRDKTWRSEEATAKNKLHQISILKLPLPSEKWPVGSSGVDSLEPETILNTHFFFVLLSFLISQSTIFFASWSAAVS